MVENGGKTKRHRQKKKQAFKLLASWAEAKLFVLNHGRRFVSVCQFGRRRRRLKSDARQTARPPSSRLCTQTRGVIKYSALSRLSALMNIFPSAHSHLVVQEGFNVMERRCESASWMLPRGLHPPASTSINLLLHSGSSSFLFTCLRAVCSGL